MLLLVVVLCHKIAFDIYIFYLLWSNVLALCQLKDNLLPINDFETTASYPCPNISGMQSSLFVNDFSRLNFIFVISLKNNGTPDANFTIGVRLIIRCIVHFRNIYKFYLTTWTWGANVTTKSVFLINAAYSILTALIIPAYILLYRRRTLQKIVGLRTARSSINFMLSPWKNPTAMPKYTVMT